MSAKNKKTILLLLVAAVLLAVVPFFAKKGAEFGGSDDAGSVMVEEIKGEAYEPWFTPVIVTTTTVRIPSITASGSCVGANIPRNFTADAVTPPCADG